MPSKLDDSSNLRFLYACLQTCELPPIDYHKVGKRFNIQAPAARMRLRRLRVSLESEEGTSKVLKKQRARDSRREPRSGKKPGGGKEGYEKHWKGMDDEDDDEELAVGKSESGGGGGLKKEESEDGEDWKTLPEASPFSFSAGPDAQTYGMDGHESTSMSMPPPAQSGYQMPQQVQPQMLSHSMPMSYAYQSPQVAIPQLPYYQPTQIDYQSEHQQELPQLEHAAVSPVHQPDGKQSLSEEGFSVEHSEDLQ